MKKLIKYVLFFALVLLIFMTKEAKASTGSTVFIGEPVVLDSYENVEITLNDVEINEETSEVKNTHLFTNISDKTITRKASIKLEDSFSNFTINSLKIVVNGRQIEKITKDGDNYNFSFEIPPQEGKKIEITYKTDNDLQNAKIIKYTMDSIKGKEVKLYKIKVILSKYDIPLVQKIWPGAYEFENNIINTEYFDFKVNNLTSTFIIQKETYKNLKYGDDSEGFYGEEEYANKYIINHAKEIMDNGFEIFYEDSNPNMVDRYKTWINLIKKEQTYIASAAESIYEYTLALLIENIGKVYYIDEYSNEKESNVSWYTFPDYCLTAQTLRRIDKGCRLNEDWYDYNLYGKKVAINYFETEGNKKLYVKLNVTGEIEDEENYPLISKNEWSILRANTFGNRTLGCKCIYVNSDIDGNKLDVTEKEIIDFVNMMNIDLYVRMLIYDAKNEHDFIKVGFYTDDAKEIASKYLNVDENIKQEEGWIKEIDQEARRDKYYIGEREVTFEEWKDYYVKDYKQKIEEIKNSFRKFDNEVVAQNSKVPTVAHCMGYCIYDKEKYIVDFYTSTNRSRFEDIYKATECEVAKTMLETNNANNEAKRNAIISKIANTKITLDSKENYIKEEKNIEIEEKIETKNSKEQQINLMQNLNDKDTKILEIIIIFIVLIVMILIIITIVNKKQKQ